MTAGSISREEYEALIKKPERQKYGAVKVHHADGYVFDSKWEAERYDALRFAQLQGEIRNLVVHPAYYLHGVSGKQLFKVTFDFGYWHGPYAGPCSWVIEDTKSGPTRTEAYVMRRKLFEDEYAPLKVTEIIKPGRQKKARRG